MSVCMVILKWRPLLHILTWTLESLLIQWQEFIQILSSDNRSLTYLNELFQSVDHTDKNLSSIYQLVSKLYSIAAIQPLSTAEVERLFSQVASNIKTEALSKILNIKYNCDLYTVKIIHVWDKCVHAFFKHKNRRLVNTMTFILVKIVSGTFITLIFFLAHVFLLIFRF